MDLKKLAEPFPANCIEWRVAQSGKNAQGVWSKVLAYIQARSIMDRLDEVCGAENWEVHYSYVASKDNPAAGVMCSLAVRCGPNGTWVTKSDGAEQTDIESFKGGISSALKRAGSAWSIGRYLYDLEEGWAKVSATRQDGYRWAKTKDGAEFYWTPPELPAWALPKKDPNPTVGEKEREHIIQLAKDNEWSNGQVVAFMGFRWRKQKVTELTQAEYLVLQDTIKTKKFGEATGMQDKE